MSACEDKPEGKWHIYQCHFEAQLFLPKKALEGEIYVDNNTQTVPWWWAIGFFNMVIYFYLKLIIS